MSAGRRTVISLSLSPKSPAAQRVLDELDAAGIPDGERSAAIIGWLVDYFDGRARSAAAPDFITIDNDELDALLDAF